MMPYKTRTFLATGFAFLLSGSSCCLGNDEVRIVTPSQASAAYRIECAPRMCF
jgi:hypothetical protein